MKYLALAVVLLAGCEQPTPNAKGGRIVTDNGASVYTVTDAQRGVTCWLIYTSNGGSISCLRDVSP